MPRLLALLLLPFSACPLLAGPTDDVMRLVPPKTTVCFVLQDLRGTAARLGDSPFAKQFAESKLGQSLLASDELKQLATVEQILNASLGLTFAALRDDILGDAVLFAYQPPVDGKEGGDSGVLIGKAAKPDVLAKVVARLNAAQIQSKELNGTVERTHNGVGYVERQKADGRTEYYLLRDDGLFAYSVQGAVLRQVIDRLAGSDDTPCPLAGAIDRLGLGSATAVLLFEPAAFATDLTTQAESTEDANQKAFLKQFARLWSAAEAVGLSLTFDTGVTLSVTAVATPNKLPKELQTLFESRAEPSPVWAVVPSNALLVIGGQFDWETFHAAFRSFLSDEGKAGLKQMFDEVVGPLVGKGALPKVLAGLGPDWAVWLRPPTDDDTGPLPTATLAVRVRPADSGDDTVGQAVVTAFDGLMHTFRLDYNAKHDDQFDLREAKADGGGIRYLRNDEALPPGVRPAYALRADYFVLASSVEAVKRFIAPKADQGVKDAPLVRLNAAELAKYLNAHGSTLGEVLAGWTGGQPDQAKGELAEFAKVLELFNTIELHHSGDGKKMSLSVTATMVKPLK